MIPDSVEMIPVTSSNVAAAGYARDFRRLYLRFRGGAEYAYEDVPETLFRALLDAPSKGGFVANVIRGGKGRRDTIYAYRRLN